MGEILFRASEAYKLAVEAKSKADKEAGMLSETTKDFVLDLFLKNKFNYDEVVLTKEMLKGITLEEQAITLVSKVKNKPRFKNTKKYENYYFKGIPDIVLKEEIEDIKISYNLKNFYKAELIKQYYWQGQVYMYLTGKKVFNLIYCLLPTPEEYITSEKLKYYYMFNCNEEDEMYIKISQQIEHNNNVINSLPSHKRIKEFTIFYNEKDINFLTIQAQKAIEYYNTLIF